MFLLAFHVISIGMLIALVWAVAYSSGRRAGERIARRSLAEKEAGPVAAGPPHEH